ncbi:MAG TPA: alpha-amylase family protein [Anaerolineae bacterium]|nr:alpha-amylase family protein [Anaerolineae bacterium]
MANWWQERPIRLVQTNLREIDARLDPREIVREVKAFDANAILFSVGGIVSFYPTQLRFQTPVPYLCGERALERTPLYGGPVVGEQAVRDFVGEAVEEAHALGLRFIARLDLSKCHKHVYESRPEWFFRRPDGKPQVYNGLFSTCVNGGYYQEYSFEIMREILARYEIDGFFFNMFGYKSYDYSGNYHGLCQCDNCQRRFREMYGQPLPQQVDPADPTYLDYIEFQQVTVDALTRSVAEFIHQHHGVALVNYQIRFADVVRSESNSAVDRPLPMWQLSGSDNVKRVRGTYPDKPSCNAAVYFVDIPYRFAAASPHQTALRLAQDLVHGGDVDLYVLGTLKQEDRQALGRGREIYRFAAQHSDVYRGMRSLAQTCLLYPQQSYAYDKSTHAAYRGAFRLLTEHQVPFDCAHDFVLEDEGAARFLGKYELLVLPDAACLSDRQAEAIDAYAQAGGCLLATGETGLYSERGRRRESYALTSLGASQVKTARHDMRSAYFRVLDRDALPFLPDTDIIFLDGTMQFVDPRPGATSSLALVPPCTFGPPEKVAIDRVESDVPGVIWYSHGAGRTAYLPWAIDALYYRHSSPAHDGLYYSVLRTLCPEPQIIVDAGGQLEVGLSAHRGDGYLLHLVNLSGHHGTAFLAPVPMRELEVRLRLPGVVGSARSLQLDKELPTWQDGTCTVLRLEALDLFDTIHLRRAQT